MYNRQEEYQRLKARCLDGLCFRCRQPKGKSKNKFLCDGCSTIRKLNRKRLRKRRAKIGLCNCGKPAKEGFRECEKCQEDARHEAERQRKKHLNAGICITCGSEVENGKKSCNKCCKRATKSIMERYENNKKLGLCPMCGVELKNDEKFRCEKCKENHRRRDKQQRDRLRKEVINHYGGKCRCCGTTTIEFLQLDHIDNDGKAHRKTVGRHIYGWAKRNNYPKTLQILCANCNFCKGKFSSCAHLKEPKIPLTKRGQQSREKRLQVIAKYGGKCVCCGESNWAFIDFDHIDGRGARHRREVGGQITAKWIIKNGYPDYLQLLCTNCNMAKAFYSTCPHQKLGFIS